MAETYVKIGHQVLTADSPTVVFSGIPTDGTYTDLYLVSQVRTARTGQPWDQIDILPNGSSSNLTGGKMYSASNGSPTSNTTIGNYVTSDDATLGWAGTLTVYIPNYASANKKVMSLESHGGTSSTHYYGMFYLAWDNSTAISSITLDSPNADIASDSTFTLYGITKGTDGTTTVTTS